ncbi:PR domain zinc finger protein 15 [Eumeta japonica]|uniref:PR domain zinc finger protein 15 n=1 Tax=Eumeta variegata TaxID=151549 RepID=A0A4C1VIJ9_EUMVA|nr:PR domain zinc finger protein 15 [Eumeta japonica]
MEMVYELIHEGHHVVTMPRGRWKNARDLIVAAQIHSNYPHKEAHRRKAVQLRGVWPAVCLQLQPSGSPTKARWPQEISGCMYNDVLRVQCSVCSKKFGYKLSLEEHIASTHESLKSHTCATCGTAYSRIRGLKRHMRAKHGPDGSGCGADAGATRDVGAKAAEGQNLQAYFKVVSKGNEMTLEVGTERMQSQVMLCD